MTLGLLYPGHSAEDDFAVVEQSVVEQSVVEQSVDVAIRLPLVHTSMTSDAHRPEELRDWGRAAALSEGAAALEPEQPDAIAWTCTSGSFVFGWQGAHDQVVELSRRCGRPATSTSLAFGYATRALGIDRVAVAASYPDEVAQLFVEFLGEAGVDVVSFGSADILHAGDVGRLGRDRVIEMIMAADVGDADAVLVPDTALHTLGILPDLEAAAGKPVLTANQVTLWHGLKILDRRLTIDWLGRLFQG